MDDLFGLGGIDNLFNDDGKTRFSDVFLDQIIIKSQIRTVFEDTEQTLADLAENIKLNGVIHPIVLNETDEGLVLVAGERRYRASKLAGLEQIPATIRKLTDEQMEAIQFAENIHHMNFQTFEIAKKLQKDLDEMGSVEALIEKLGVSRGWISKRLSLLTLPDEAKRLINEGISADIEVINTVKTVEKIDPEAAKALVDDLKQSRGKEDARSKAKEVKDKVKPKPSKKADAKQEKAQPIFDNEPENDFSDDVDDFVSIPSIDVENCLKRAYSALLDKKKAQAVIDSFNGDEKEAIKQWLMTFYESGIQSTNIQKIVIQGLQKGQFSTVGGGAFALAAFLQGVESEQKFSLLNIFASFTD